MKKTLLVLAMALCVGHAFAQSVGIETMDGTEAGKYTLSDVRVIDLTNSANIRVIGVDGTVLSEGLSASDISLSFTERATPTAIDQTEVQEAVSEFRVWSDGGQIHVSGAKAGDVIGIFAVSGVLLYRGTMASDTATIDVSDLRSGVYVIKIGTKALKITKK